MNNFLHSPERIVQSNIAAHQLQTRTMWNQSLSVVLFITAQLGVFLGLLSMYLFLFRVI